MLVGRAQRAPVAHDHGEARPVDVLDHEVRRLVLGVGVEHLRGTERRHLPGPGDLAAEAEPELLVVGEIVANDLERHESTGRRLGKEHTAHAAFADAAAETVRA